MKSSILYGIIGAGVAIAAVVGFVLIMPQLTAQSSQQQPALTPEQQERQQVLNTPNTGQPGEPIIQHQELRAQDPTFDTYLLAAEKCSTETNTGTGNTLACMTTHQSAVDRYCNIDSQEYHTEKCDIASMRSTLYENGVKLQSSIDRLINP